MKKLIVLVIIFMAVSFSERVSAERNAIAGLADTPWPMYQHDPQHTGRSPFLGILQNPTLLFEYQMPFRIEFASGPMAIDQGGNIITPAGGTLQSIDPIRHTSNWTFTQPGYGNQTPLIGQDGNIYWGKGLNFYKITPQGEVDETVTVQSTNFAFDSSSTFGQDGNIYFVHDGIFSVTPDVYPRWGYWYSFYASNQSPAIGLDGSIYAPGSYDLSAYSPNGDILWSILTPRSSRYGTSAVGEDGTIYIPAHGSLYAINPNSTIQWEFTVPQEDDNGNAIIGTAIAPDGTIYGLMYQSSPSGNSMLYAVSPAGQMKWKKSFTQNLITGRLGTSNKPLLTDRNGNVYLCLLNSRCYGYGPDGTALWEIELPLVDSIEVLAGEPVLAADGLMYLIDNNSRLYAYADANQYPVLKTPIDELSYEVSAGTPTFTATVPITSTLLPVSYTVVVTPTSWLSALNLQGATPGEITITLDPSTFSPGKYKGMVSVRTTGRVGSWIDLPVRLMVKNSFYHGSSVYLPLVAGGSPDSEFYAGHSRIIYQRMYFLDRQLVSIDRYGENLKIVANQLPQIDRMTVSRDGSMIALNMVIENLPMIRIIDARTGNLILEIKDQFYNTEPAFSPDGSQLIFNSSRDGPSGELYRIDVDGGHLIRLTNNEHSETSFFWSPQGDKIVVGQQWSSTFLMNPDGTEIQWLGKIATFQMPLGWSPDGRYILLDARDQDTSPHELWIYDRLKDRYQWIDTNIKTTSPVAWSPDGVKIGYLKGSYHNWYLYIFYMDRRVPMQVLGPISEDNTEDPHWSWSLDGHWITISRELVGDQDNDDIFLIEAKSFSLQRLTSNIKDDKMPLWQRGD